MSTTTTPKQSPFITLPDGLHLDVRDISVLSTMETTGTTDKANVACIGLMLKGGQNIQATGFGSKQNRDDQFIAIKKLREVIFFQEHGKES